MKPWVDDYISSVDLEGMEKEGARFKIPVPDITPFDLKFEASINQVTDKFIYRKIFFDMVAQLFVVSRVVRISTTNDLLRKEIKSYEDIPPAYKTNKHPEAEPISLGEAFHIWNHLSLRYNQIQMNHSFLGFVHDLDFKLIMQQGLDTLKKQTSELEKKALSFEVVLPKRPPPPCRCPLTRKH